ncbi:transporter substrate-binding domain-containing protein [Pseudomonas sp. SA3-5]|uniref:Transporter substrate-binding domain-containing protein n=1 Tax=Pseudomonas aestuarii TaxID=3018340 RepID=A0ABT4XCH3_9PSED|nr:transporter substrate-binding domain-containing protein [Pseudomonas aestuarii]MDA7085899.1 transporter substrate-binding domain-containing protein [Pseudomonas aestuarii]
MSGAEALRWGFSPADDRPYVEVRNHQLLGGFTHRLGSRVGQRLNLELQFVETPNRRIEEFIQRGRIHLICNANPEWVAEPRRYRWSPKLYQEEDVLLLHDRQPPVTGLHDLYGKSLGTRLGYIYSLPLMEAFARELVIRQNVRDLDSGLYLLSKQRLDALIDMRRPLTYKLAQRPELPLHVSDWVVQRYDLSCIYGQQMPISAERLDKVLLELRDSGAIAEMLDGTSKPPLQ